MQDPSNSHCKCGACVFWEHTDTHEGVCRRHAPATNENTDVVAHWPQTHAENGCGEGISADDPTFQPVKCAACIYWDQFTGGLIPANRRDQTADWWRRAGHCARYAPRPSRDPGVRAFWCATSANDSCADGKPRPP